MNKLVLIAISLVLFGCGGGDLGKEIMFYENDNEIALQKTIKVLDVPDSLVFGNVSHIEFVGDKIFVLMSQSNLSVLIAFNIDGEYIGKVGDHGRGKGEYLSLTSFTTYNNEIYLIDVAKSVVLVYDIKTFEYIREHKIVEGITAISYLRDDLMVAYTQIGDDYFEYMGASYEIERGFVKNIRGAENSGYVSGTFNPMCMVGRKVMLHAPFSATIYEADENGVIPKYLLKFADFEMPSKNFIIKISNEITFFQDLYNSEYISYIGYKETKDAILANISVKNTWYIGYYRKGDANGQLMKSDKFYNGGVSLVGVWGDYFVASADAAQEGFPVNDIVLLLIK